MSSVSNSVRRRRFGCAGTTSLELALVMLPFLWLMMGTIDIGRYLFTVQSMTTVMTDAHRSVMLAYAAGGGNAVPEGCFNFSSWSSTAHQYANTTDGPPPLLDPAQGTVIVTAITKIIGWGTQQMQVTVRYPFVPITPWLNLLTGALVANGDPCAGAGDDTRLMEQATYAY